ncbi:HPP family protein [Azonexus sp. IMCC34842]|uniref:HPP family protein n=1 Tax=Azonexus sp. IMCC34842 TaxID=3420950 RepID=UPI003D0F333D
MKLENRWRDYWQKMHGTTRGSPPRVSNEEILLSWIGAFVGIGSLAGLGQVFFADGDLVLMIGSFGASAVLLFGAVRSPLAQPRNLLGGHIISALTGVICWKCLYFAPWLAAALAVATAIALMHATRTLHPPGGATALIAVIGSADIHQLSFWYVLVPATLGPLIMLIIALLINNLPRSRRYPEIWF